MGVSGVRYGQINGQFRSFQFWRTYGHPRSLLCILVRTVISSMPLLYRLTYMCALSCRLATTYSTPPSSYLLSTRLVLESKRFSLSSQNHHTNCLTLTERTDLQIDVIQAFHIDILPQDHPAARTTQALQGFCPMICILVSTSTS